MGEGQAIQQMVLEQMDIKGKKTWNLEPHISHKINSKWITDLNIKCTTLKTLKRKYKRKSSDIRLDKEFLYMMPKTQSIKGKYD